MAKKAEYLEWVKKVEADGYEVEFLEWIQSYFKKAKPPIYSPYPLNNLNSIEELVKHHTYNDNSEGVLLIQKIRNAWKQKVRRTMCLEVAQTIEISPQAKAILKSYAKNTKLSQNKIINEAILKFSNFYSDFSDVLNEKLENERKLLTLTTNKYLTEINHLREEVARLTSENHQLWDELEDQLDTPISES